MFGHCSRRHACIEYDESKRLYTLSDLGALNGIALNRRRIRRAVLAEGDVIQLGGVSHVEIGDEILTDDICIKYRFKLMRTKEVVPTSAMPSKPVNMNNNKEVKDEKTDVDVRKANKHSLKSVGTPCTASVPNPPKTDPIVSKSASSSGNVSGRNGSPRLGECTVQTSALRGILGCPLCRYIHASSI
jgi:hypothetical protein